MDATAHYRQLVQLGREEFLAAAAPAALVQFRMADDLVDGARSLSGQTVGSALPVGAGGIDETLPHDPRAGTHPPAGTEDLAIYPLAKKAGASFPDRITLGRTPNNDLAIADPSVSRLHAYVKQVGGGWVVADAGSKNGSWLDDAALEPRKERTLTSKALLRVGDIDLTFFLAADLYAVLGGA